MIVYVFPKKVNGPVILMRLVVLVQDKRLLDPSLQLTPEIGTVKGAKINK